MNWKMNYSVYTSEKFGILQPVFNLSNSLDNQTWQSLNCRYILNMLSDPSLIRVFVIRKKIQQLTWHCVCHSYHSIYMLEFNYI